MADDKISETGVWFDTEKRKVVDGKQPVNAIQLVAPGHPVTANAQIWIDNYKNIDTEPERAVDLSVGVETATQKTVTTGTVKKS